MNCIFCICICILAGAHKLRLLPLWPLLWNVWPLTCYIYVLYTIARGRLAPPSGTTHQCFSMFNVSDHAQDRLWCDGLGVLVRANKCAFTQGAVLLQQGAVLRVATPVNWIQLISTGIFTMEGGSLAPGGGGAALRPKTGRSEGSAGWIFTFHSKWSISGVNFNPNRSIKFSQKGLKGKKHDEKWYPIGVYLAFEYPNRGCTGVKKGGLKGGTSPLTLTEGMPPPPPRGAWQIGSLSQFMAPLCAFWN